MKNQKLLAFLFSTFCFLRIINKVVFSWYVTLILINLDCSQLKEKCWLWRKSCLEETEEVWTVSRNLLSSNLFGAKGDWQRQSSHSGPNLLKLSPCCDQVTRDQAERVLQFYCNK